MAHVYFFATALVFGSNFILMKMGTQVFSPVAVAIARVGGGALVLLAAMWLGKQWPRLSARQWRWTVVAGLLGNALPFVVMPWLLYDGVDHSFLAMFVPATPLMTILVSVPLLGIGATWRQLLGVVGGLILLVALSFEGSTHGATWLQIALALTVPVAYAVSNTLIRRELSGVGALPLTAWMLVLSTMTTLPFLAAPKIGGIWAPGDHDPESIRRALAALVVVGALGTGVAIAFFVKLVHDRGPLFAGMVTYVVPPIALFWGWLDSEPITPLQLTAVGGILVMVALVQYNPSARRTEPAIPTEPVAVVD